MIAKNLWVCYNILLNKLTGSFSLLKSHLYLVKIIQISQGGSKMQDITLVCKDCGNEFVWTAGEQEFYQQKGLVNQPVRCPECRKKRKAEREARESQNA